jgi:hypothetical protein
MENELLARIEKLEKDFAKHQHDGFDGTNTLKKSIDLDDGEYLSIGMASHGVAPITNVGTASEQIQYAMSVGKDDGRTGFVNKADLLQLDFIHQPRGSLSFISAKRTPLVSSFENTSISTTLGGNTVTTTGFNFTTNELAGAIINIYKDGSFVESKIIASNTATVITITTTWKASTSGGTFDIYIPVYLGSANNIWKRIYCDSNQSGGIRFGDGPTGVQNSLLYTNDFGNLYFRAPSFFGQGSSTTQFDITKDSNTVRYTWDGNGTNPFISSSNFPPGALVEVNVPNFNSANNFTFPKVITGSGDDYFEVTNASGVAENNKTMGSGYISIVNQIV